MYHACHFSSYQQRKRQSIKRVAIIQIGENGVCQVEINDLDTLTLENSTFRDDPLNKILSPPLLFWVIASGYRGVLFIDEAPLRQITQHILAKQIQQAKKWVRIPPFCEPGENNQINTV